MLDQCSSPILCKIIRSLRIFWSFGRLINGPKNILGIWQEVQNSKTTYYSTDHCQDCSQIKSGIIKHYPSFIMIYWLTQPEQSWRWLISTVKRVCVSGLIRVKLDDVTRWGRDTGSDWTNFGWAWWAPKLDDALPITSSKQDLSCEITTHTDADVSTVNNKQNKNPFIRNLVFLNQHMPYAVCMAK